MADPWMQTYSGVAFDLLTPRAQDVNVGDVVHALARINRYNGHTREAYTVAQHSVHVMELLALWGAPAEVQRQGLLHDAPEAYYGDITSPIQRAIAALISAHTQKDIFWDPLLALRARVDLVVHKALGLPETLHPLVKRADIVILACERRDLMSECERDWELPEFPDTRISIKPWAAYEVEKRFASALGAFNAPSIAAGLASEGP